jgi:hypothetical protein
MSDPWMAWNKERGGWDIPKDFPKELLVVPPRPAISEKLSAVQRILNNWRSEFRDLFSKQRPKARPVVKP